ncbi:hypothetical protein DFH07DRAFT_263690 [Mycena maculata]|uniref:RNase III domain-containing protein n=1 Tax=Mycena maculata TaxID=230809 RepID=A0AAD7MN46_9AGAR|nr:hypothetical protein DFH07DRAFT_263690 [Mycena maculata]
MVCIGLNTGREQPYWRLHPKTGRRSIERGSTHPTITFSSNLRIALRKVYLNLTLPMNKAPTYRPSHPPTNKIYVSRIDRERLEIYGDALLGFKLVSFLFHRYPSQGPGFISTIKAALLSNHTFTNISQKADGHTDPKGFPLDKAVADDFETNAALSYFDLGFPKFEAWFLDTFIPLVDEAVSL